MFNLSLLRGIWANFCIRHAEFDPNFSSLMSNQAELYLWVMSERLYSPV